jgi:pyruvate formate lyase activating enzyme
MEYTDLVILDIKEINPARHKQITGFENDNILDMARYLSEIGKPVWIRHVLVPTLSDFDDDLEKLAEFVSGLTNVRKVEVLPYHTLGRFKWENMGLKYSLDNVSPPTADRVANAEKILKIK